MSRREKTRSPQSRSTGPEQSAQWAGREQLSVPVELQAEKLLREAGSPERAKHAVDEAAKSVAPEAEAREQVARQLGFSSHRELAAASTSLVIPGRDRWWVVPVGERWKAWNGAGVLLAGEYASIEEARRQITTGA
jgi:hypothetical protein